MTEAEKRLVSLLEAHGVGWAPTSSEHMRWTDRNGDDVVVLHSDEELVLIRAWVDPQQAVGMTLGIAVAGNAELREFCSQLMRFIEPSEHQGACNRECPAYGPCKGSRRCEFVSWAIDVAARLGIEVGA